ncbi:MAG: hypothetical protein GXO82_07335 [Chlorobi bacterium]|nr:hypothetical protein [Chlorobiota bacterium]
MRASTLTLFVLCFNALCLAQNYRPYIDSTAMGAYYEIRDGDNVPYSHLVKVCQDYDSSSLCYLCGEIYVKKSTGDTIDVMWNTVLRKHRMSPRVPVYERNSNQYANELRSFPFELEQGDTLYFFRDYEVEVPHDTSNLEIKDTMLFKIEILDNSTGDVVKVLDSLLIPPATGWAEHVYPIFESMYSGDYSPDPIIKWVPRNEDTTWYSKSLSLRVEPIFYPQRYGAYDRRTIFAQFTWNTRPSKYLKSEAFADHIAFLQPILDSILATGSLSNVRSVDDYEKNNPTDIVVYPTFLRQQESTLFVSNIKEYERIKVWIFNAAGKLELEKEYHTNHRNTISIPLKFRARTSGAHFMLLRTNTETVKLHSYVVY